MCLKGVGYSVIPRPHPTTPHPAPSSRKSSTASRMGALITCTSTTPGNPIPPPATYQDLPMKSCLSGEVEVTRFEFESHGSGRFDGGELLRRYKGKSIMFVGDSLSRNQWQSLICMLYSSVPGANYNIETASGEVSTFTFTDFGVKVMLDHTVYLVDVVREAEGRILKLDSIQGCKRWKGIDVLIFNTWHWWNRRGATQPTWNFRCIAQTLALLKISAMRIIFMDYIEVGGKLYKDMDRVVAFEKALTTWAKWVDTNVDPANTKWEHVERTKSEIVRGQREPVAGSMYPGGLPPALAVLKKVLSGMKKHVELLDITNLSLLRKDGHPSVYGLGGMDCSHWCLPGVPDTWNLILYILIL
ncbi:UNVERIFIED_CONTAM: protein trichome birefringence-like 41 [Sesamum calycinum]|uniref:Protein trichome birefringence-like 41 n=1 Tax=Sesamum calycinum TaxID=2727403 RepID=A0AAW2KL08_9LAMI